MAAISSFGAFTVNQPILRLARKLSYERLLQRCTNASVQILQLTNNTVSVGHIFQWLILIKTLTGSVKIIN